MPQFDFYTYSSQIFWLLVVFGSLYLAVDRFLVPKVDKIIKNRQNILDSNIKQAISLSEQATKLTTIYQAERQLIQTISEDLKQAAVAQTNLAFEQQRRQLAAELQISARQALDDISRQQRSFDSGKSTACLNLAQFIIEKISCKPANLTLLNQLWKN